MEYVPQYIIVHHSAANEPVPQFEAINEWHKERDFPISDLGYFVGYHRVIERDGTVRVARNDLERDADALGHNFDSLSVCLVGNMDENLPTVAQEHALGLMLDEWVQKYGLSKDVIYPHRHFANKSCYGSKLPDDWAQRSYMRAMATRILQENTDPPGVVE